MGKEIMNLSDRMKMYERHTKQYLQRRMPVVVRVDGKAFHTFTKNFPKPFSEVMSRTMQSTMKYLCDNIQGCIFGYTQSDEISLILIDYQKYETDAWFDNNLQKIVSVSSSMATMAFNKYFEQHLKEYISKHTDSMYSNAIEAMIHSFEKGALFDSRAFNISEDEIANYIYCRYNDAFRNGISTYARNTLTNMPKKVINKLSTKEKISAIMEASGNIVSVYYDYGHNFFGTYYTSNGMVTMNHMQTSGHFHKIIREVIDAALNKNEDKKEN